MVSGIYRIVYNNKIVYVGSSNDVKKRWGQHKRNLKEKKHHNYLLQRVYDKYGFDVFKFDLI